MKIRHETNYVYRRSHSEHSKYRETAGQPRLCPEPRWGSSQRSPRTLSWWEGAGKNPKPAFGPSGLRRRGLFSNPHSENPGFALALLSVRLVKHR